MCLPAVAAGAAAPYLLGAQTGLSILGAKSQYDRELAVAADAAAQANKSAVVQYTQLQNRQMQEAAQAAQAIRTNANKARAAEGTLRVSLGESGIAGNTAAELHAGFERTASEYEGAVIRNKAFLDANFRDQATAVQEGAHAEAAQAYAKVQPPSYLGILLQGVGSYLNLSQQNKELSPIHASVPGSSAVAGADPSAGIGDFTESRTENQYA
jgi:hypothetical protein